VKWVSSERPPGDRDDRDHERRRLERILPELIKRIVEVGAGKLSEGPENVRQFVSDLKLPKEVLTLILGQLDETKNGLYRAVAKELRDFLEQTNLAEELAKVLTTLSFEIKTEIRFIPNDARANASPKPDVRAKVQVKKNPPERASAPPSDDEPSSSAAPAGEAPAPREEEER